MLEERDWEVINKTLLKLYRLNGINKNLEDFSEKEKTTLDELKSELSQSFRENAYNPAEKSGELFLLSKREVEVLEQIMDGKSNADISELLKVSLSTVKKHIYNIFNKVGVNSRTQLLNMIYTK